MLRALPRNVSSPRRRGLPVHAGRCFGRSLARRLRDLTRLAPRSGLRNTAGCPTRPCRSMEVAEEIASPASCAGRCAGAPELAHSVHVELSGLGPSAATGRFTLPGSEASLAGTARTAPASGVMADRLRIGVAGCQHWEAGFSMPGPPCPWNPSDLIFHMAITSTKAGRPLGGRSCAARWRRNLQHR